MENIQTNDPNQSHNQVQSNISAYEESQPSEITADELASVSGGGILDGVADLAKEMYKQGEELGHEIGEAIFP